MKEHTQKNARIPPAFACSAVPGLSAEPPPLGTDSGFTAFHMPRMDDGRVPGCLDRDCERLGCYLVRTDDVGPGICGNGCRVASQYFTTRSLVRACCAPDEGTALEGKPDRTAGPASRLFMWRPELWVGPWEVVSPDSLARFNASGRAAAVLESVAYCSSINGVPLPAWKWTVSEFGLGGIATGFGALGSAMSAADASLAAIGRTLAPQRTLLR